MVGTRPNTLWEQYISTYQICVECSVTAIQAQHEDQCLRSTRFCLKYDTINWGSQFVQFQSVRALVDYESKRLYSDKAVDFFTPSQIRAA